MALSADRTQMWMSLSLSVRGPAGKQFIPGGSNERL